MDDLERRLVAMVAAHRVVMPWQLARYGGQDMDLSMTGDRLAAEGVLRFDRWQGVDEPLVRVTAAGLAAIGSRLDPPGLVLGDVRTELDRVSVWLAAWEGTFGEMSRVLSRREADGLDRAAVESAGALTGFRLRAAGGVYPDVAMLSQGGNRIAVHCLRWPQRTVDLRSLLEGHRSASARVDAVLLMADSTVVEERCKALVEELGMSDWVHVRGSVTGAKNRPAGYR